MNVTLGLAQTCHPVDGDVIALVRSYAQKAKEAGVDLLVFPESLMSAYEKEREAFINESQPMDGPFVADVLSVARETGLWIIFTMNERAPQASCDTSTATNNEATADSNCATTGNALPYNTVLIADNAGTLRGFYRKTHLFDTDFTQESSRMQAGDQLFVPIETPFGKLGLAICYDLRFPEVARAAALQGCDIMFYPAAWVDGKLKAQQWKTLLAARALENGIFVCGVSRADKGYIGQSCVVDPQGTIIAQAGPDEQLLTCTIDTSLIERVRAGMPSLEHRRPALYGSN